MAARVVGLVIMASWFCPVMLSKLPASRMSIHEAWRRRRRGRMVVVAEVPPVFDKFTMSPKLMLIGSAMLAMELACWTRSPKPLVPAHSVHRPIIAVILSFESRIDSVHLEPAAQGEHSCTSKAHNTSKQDLTPRAFLLFSVLEALVKWVFGMHFHHVWVIIMWRRRKRSKPMWIVFVGMMGIVGVRPTGLVEFMREMKVVRWRRRTRVRETTRVKAMFM